MLRNFQNDKIFLSSKFLFSAMEFVKVIKNKPVFLLKALDPCLELLEEFQNSFLAIDDQA